MAREFRPVHFVIKLDYLKLERVGCNHELTHGALNWQPNCRSCSVGCDLYVSGIEISWTEDLHCRVFFGEAKTVEQRDALTRMIALAYGHAEPRDLVAHG